MAGEYNNPLGAQPLGTGPGASPASPTPDERTWGMLAHLSSVLAILLGGMSFLGPLIVWLVKKDQSAFVDDQGKEALNFQIAVLLANKGVYYRYPYTLRLIN